MERGITLGMKPVKVVPALSPLRLEQWGGSSFPLKDRFQRRNTGAHIYSARNNKKNAPGGTRTPDLRLRKPPLYPAELLGRLKMEAAGIEPASERATRPRVSYRLSPFFRFTSRPKGVGASPEGRNAPSLVPPAPEEREDRGRRPTLRGPPIGRRVGSDPWEAGGHYAARA